DRIGDAVTVIVITEVVVTRVRQAEGVTQLMNLGRLAVAAVPKVRVVAAVGADPDVAADAREHVVPVARRIVSPRLRRTARRVRQQDVGSQSLRPESHVVPIYVDSLEVRRD